MSIYRGSLIVALSSMIFLSSSLEASAGEGTATVKSVMAQDYSTDFGIIELTADITGSAPCVTLPLNSKKMILNLATAAGKAAYATALTAMVSGIDLHIKGLGTCNLLGTTGNSFEDLSWAKIQE